jgi:antitoxin component of MazEF toxin-antitoxin module
MDLQTKKQKLIKVGNSFAVTIDKQMIARHFSATPEVDVRMDLDTGEIVVRPAKTDSVIAHKKASLSSKVTPELQEWTQKFLIENAESLEKLANIVTWLEKHTIKQ